jgi:hypothetical protein
VNTKSNRQIAAVAYIVVVHAPVTALTWRDLQHRRRAQVRGPKVLWRLASLLNTLGSAAYWLFGRRALR